MDRLTSAALDRWLTTEPDDGFTSYWENVANLLPDEIWNEIDREDTSAFYEQKEPVANRLVWYCFSKDYNPVKTANYLSAIYQKKLNGCEV